MTRAYDRTGTLAGIARHPRAKAAMETVDRVAVTVDGGIAGDGRGVVKPGGLGRRQVTLIAAADWAAALAQIDADLPWQERRANLLVAGIALPRAPGARIVIGSVVLEVTRECDPCERMDALAPGLRAALTPDWRGGVCTRVKAGGAIAVGDEIGIELP